MATTIQDALEAMRRGRERNKKLRQYTADTGPYFHGSVADASEALVNEHRRLLGLPPLPTTPEEEK